MNKKLNYKNITMDAFTFYNEDKDEHKQEDNIKSLDFNGYGWSYICPHCVKKYNLYKEVGTKEQAIEDVINSGYEDDFICCIDGCENKNAMEFSFEINECELV